MVQVHPYIGEEFKAWSKLHPNFMTPKVRRAIIVDDKVIEVSEGTGFEREDEDIYGVSVFERVEEFKFKKDRTQEAHLFYDFNEALAYAKELKRKLELPPVYHGPEEHHGGRRPEVRVRGHPRRVR
jgi:hypothetical protein